MKRKIGLDMGWYLALGAVATAFTVSGNLLTNAGSSYISDGGNFLQKIHPGSYLSILSGASTLMSGTSRTAVFRISWLVMAFLAGITFCAIYAVFTNGVGNVVVLIDTFIPAGMLALAIGNISDEKRRQLKRLAQCLLLLNACIAVGELATQTHLVPVPTQGSGKEEEFRPTALYDHPLTGAAATMLGFWIAPRRRLAKWLYEGVLIAALLAFGERTPIALVSLSLLVLVLDKMCKGLLARDLHSAHMARIGAMGLAFACLTLAAITAGGEASTRLGAHLYWDDSAQVRLSQFGIIGALDWREFFFGCPRADLLAMIEPLRLSSHVAVIENFWLFTFVTLGLFCFPVFVLSFVLLLKWLWRVSGSSGRAMIVLFVVVASASNSLGRKSTLLVILVACVIASIAQRVKDSLPIVARAGAA